MLTLGCLLTVTGPADALVLTGPATGKGPEAVMGAGPLLIRGRDARHIERLDHWAAEGD